MAANPYSLDALNAIVGGDPAPADGPDPFSLDALDAIVGAPAPKPATDKPWTSDVAEMGRQLVGGAVVGVPQQLGQAAKWASEPGRPLYTAGQSLVAGAEARAPGWAPNMEGRGPFAGPLIEAAGQIAPSVAIPAAVGLGLAALPGSLPAAAGLGLSAAAGGIGMGMAQAQDTYERVKQATGDEAAARRAGWLSGTIEGGGETAANIAGGKLLGIGAKTAGKMLETGVVKPFLSQFGKTLATEVGTEAAQSGGEAAVESAYGVPGVDPWAEALHGAKVAAGMTGILAPFGLGASYSQAQRNKARIANEGPGGSGFVGPIWSDTPTEQPFNANTQTPDPLGPVSDPGQPAGNYQPAAGSDPLAAGPAGRPPDIGPAGPGAGLGGLGGLRGPVVSAPPGGPAADPLGIPRPAVTVPLTAAPEDAGEEIDLLKGPRAPLDTVAAPLSAPAPLAPRPFTAEPQYFAPLGLTPPGAPLSPQLPPESPQLRSDAPAWVPPTATDRPDPNAIVRNRTVGGLGLGAAIDAQTGVGRPGVPVPGQSWGWDKPGFDVAPVASEAPPMAEVPVAPHPPVAPDVRQEATPPNATPVAYEPGAGANTFHLKGNADAIQATLKAAGLPIGSRLDDGTVRLNNLLRAKVEGVFPQGVNNSHPTVNSENVPEQSGTPAASGGQQAAPNPPPPATEKSNGQEERQGQAETLLSPPGAPPVTGAVPVEPTTEEPSKLTQFRNDLIEVRSRINEQGNVVDARLTDRERQLVRVIKELEAAEEAPVPPSNTNEYINHAKFVAAVAAAGQSWEWAKPETAERKQLYSKGTAPQSPATTVRNLAARVRAAMEPLGKGTGEQLLASGWFHLITSERATIGLVANKSQGESVFGYHDPTTGQTYLVADNIPDNLSDKDLRGLILHEAGVHALHLGRGGAEFKAILDQFGQMTVSDPRAAAALKRAVDVATPQAHLLEESLAYFLEAHPDLPFVRKVLAWFKRQLRKLGLKLELTPDDLVTMAREALRAATRPEQGEGQALFSRAGPDAQAFVPAPDGAAAFGEIPLRVAAKIKRQAGEIRLQVGVHDDRLKSGFGVRHIEAGHGDDIRRAGFPTVGDFVAEVASHYTEIRKTDRGRLKLIEVAGPHRVLVVELIPTDQQDVWTVITAYPARSVGKGLLLWSAAQSRDHSPGGNAAFARESVKAGQTPPDAKQQSNDNESVAQLESDDGDIRYSFGAAPQTETPEFARWFGASKIKAGGKPEVVYHGTNQDIAAFDQGKLRNGKDGASISSLGFFFARDQGDANEYAAKAAERGGEAQTQGYYVRVESPYVVTSDLLSERMGDMTAEEFRAKLQAKGHDGVYIKDAGYVVAFAPTQVKSVANRGTFDPENPNVRYSRGYTAPQQAALDRHKAALAVNRKPLRQRFNEATAHWQTAWAQKLVDRYRSFRDVLKDPDLWMQARLSGQAESVTVAGMEFGAPQWDSSGAISVEMNAKPLKTIATELQGEIDDFLRYVAGHRAQLINDKADRAAARARSIAHSIKTDLDEIRRIKKQPVVSQADTVRMDRLRTELSDKKAQRQAAIKASKIRERWLTPDDIAAFQSLDQGNMDDGQARPAIYAQAMRDYNKLSEAFVNLGVESGTISQDDADRWANEGVYVPFYRFLQDDEGNAQRRGLKDLSSLEGQTAFKRFKGADIPINDLLSNVLANWQHLADSSLKNASAVKAVNAAEALGLIDKVPAAIAPKDAIWVRTGGKPQYWKLTDPDNEEARLVFEALEGMHYGGLDSSLTRIASTMAGILRTGVTANPAFRVRNLVRDTLQALATSNVPLAPFKAVVEGWKETGPKTQAELQRYANMMASGGLFGHHQAGYVREGNPELSNAAARRALGMKPDVDGAIPLTKETISRLYAAYQSGGARFENVNRAAAFSKTLDETGSLLRAAFEANDLLPFQMRGTSHILFNLARMVPFLNARLQGLDKLARSAIDPQTRGRFFAVSGAYIGLSLLAYLAIAGDDDYEALEEWRKDAYHYFKIGGQLVKIPRPFELGVMASMVERLAEQIVRSGEVPRTLFIDRLGAALGQTLSFNPIPQAIMPALEVAMNKDSFTGRPIETMGMEFKSKTERKQDTSSYAAVGVSNALDAVWKTLSMGRAETPLSPVQIDSMVQGYLGWVGSFALAGSNLILDQVTLAPERPDDWRKWPVVGEIGNAFSDPAIPNNTAYSTEFYRHLDVVRRASADLSAARKAGDVPGVREIAAERRKELGLSSSYNAAASSVSAINRAMRNIRLNRDMTGAEKREKLDVLMQRKNALFRKVEDSRGKMLN